MRQILTYKQNTKKKLHIKSAIRLKSQRKYMSTERSQLISLFYFEVKNAANTKYCTVIYELLQNEFIQNTAFCDCRKNDIS